MNSQFVFLSATPEELVEIHRALMSRFIIENALRQEQGLEPIDPAIIIARCELLLGYTKEQSHELFHAVEDELWAYSWYSYTDEWAWHRARQEVQKKLGSQTKRTKRDALERLVEKAYTDQFESFVSEIDMQEKIKETKKKSAKKKSSKN